MSHLHNIYIKIQVCLYKSQPWFCSTLDAHVTTLCALFCNNRLFALIKKTRFHSEKVLERLQLLRGSSAPFFITVWSSPALSKTPLQTSPHQQTPQNRQWVWHSSQDLTAIRLKSSSTFQPLHGEVLTDCCSLLYFRTSKWFLQKP